MAAVPNSSDAVTQYASHRLLANVQFYAIKNMQSMKTDQSIIYMIPDHKHKKIRDIARDRLIIMVKNA